jgi:tetratricopeptide (TPR) repeat protein
MRRGISIAGLFGLCAFVLFAALQTGCKSAKSDEIPITTKSKEARELFIEARKLAEFQHTEKANEIFAQAVEKDPEFAMGYLFKAGSSVGSQDFKADLAKAVSLAQKASEGEQKVIAAFQAYYGENDTVKANQIFQELTALLPNDKRAHYYLAWTYGQMQDYDKQAAALQNTIALDPNFPPAYQDLGYIYRWKNQYDKAEEYFKEYVRLSPGEANGHDCLGDLYRKMGRFDEAIQQYTEAIQMDPTFILSQYQIGSTLAFQGNFEEGRRAFTKAMDMELDPGNKVYDQEGIMRTSLYEGDYAGALEAADKAIAMAADLGVLEEAAFNHVVKSAIYCELGEYDKAEASLADCLNFLETADMVASNKENIKAGATFWQAVVAAGRQDFDRAMAKAEEYKEKVAAINNPAMKKYPGWLLGYLDFIQGDAAKAIEHFSQGEIDNPWFIYYLAAAKEKAGDAEGAAKLYKKVADWNLDTVWYSFVRPKAIAKLKT